MDGWMIDEVYFLRLLGAISDTRATSLTLSTTCTFLLQRQLLPLVAVSIVLASSLETGLKSLKKML